MAAIIAVKTRLFKLFIKTHKSFSINNLLGDKNIYNENELIFEATVAKFATVQIEGQRKIKREIEHYNLDVIISVGYGVNSKRGIFITHV